MIGLHSLLGEDRVTGKTVPWGPSGRRFGLAICLLGASVLVLPALASSESGNPTLGHACSEATFAQAPESVQQWLVRSMYASHCYAFQARAVSIDSVGVRTLALSHRIRNGIRQQVVQHLDGPSVSVERRSRVGQLAWFASDGSLSTAPGVWADHVISYYDVSLENEERVAGRTAVQLLFSPHDDRRYYHTWWIDKDTGLLLKHVLSDAQGRVLETFQMTQLQSPELYSGVVANPGAADVAATDWHVEWLPEGFVGQPVEPSESNVEQRFFSDGLAAVSVFATPVEQSDLETGVHELGVSAVAVEFINVGEQRWQLVGIGELPPAQLQRIVQSIAFD